MNSSNRSGTASISCFFVSKDVPANMGLSGGNNKLLCLSIACTSGEAVAVVDLLGIAAVATVVALVSGLWIGWRVVKPGACSWPRPPISEELARCL